MKSRISRAFRQLSLGLLAVLIAVPAFAADIALKLDIVEKDGAHFLRVRNTGTSPAPLTGLDITFAGMRLTNALNAVVQPGEEPDIPVAVPPAPCPGSFNLSVILQYRNDSTICSLVANKRVDSGKAEILDLKADILTESIYVKGSYRIRFKDPSLMPYSRLLLPPELAVMEVVQVLPDTLEYHITNLNNNFNNRYTIYLISDRDTFSAGTKSHAAGSVSKDITTGVWYYHYDKVFLFTIISCVVAFLLVVGFIIAGLMISKKGNRELGRGFIFGALVFLLAFGTFYSAYYLPNSAFWDENYHIASAQKEIDGVMYMEPHPPLGKMFIGLGEVLIHPNRSVDTSGFLTTDYIKPFPADYSFMGMRFFPVVFAILGAVLLFAILWIAIGTPVYAFLFSFMYIFDNALVVHFRGAMLDPIQVFFVLLALLLFLVITKREPKPRDYLGLGAAIGLALAVKVNSAVLILLLGFIAFLDYKDKVWAGKIAWKDVASFAYKAALGAFGVILPFFFVFYLHGAFGSKVLANRNYAASEEYLKMVRQNDNANPLNLYIVLRDNFKYMDNYQRGVPRLDLAKPGENGSPAIGWPVGARTIHYAWTVDDKGLRTLTIVPNAASWFMALLAVLLSVGLFMSRYVFGLKVKNEKLFWQIMFFTGLYIAYMFAVIRIERVMYLYHYFIPLMFGFVLTGLMFRYIFEDEIEKKDKVVLWAVILFAVLVVAIFGFFSFMTYYQTLSPVDFHKRVWFDFWGLKYVSF